MNTRKFYLVGAGTGQPNDLTQQAHIILKKSQVILSPKRIANSLKSCYPQIQIAEINDILPFIEASDKEQITILVSGDSGFFSLATTLQKKLKKIGQVEILPGMSSLQFFCARLGKCYQDIHFVSAHGKHTSLLGPVSYHKKVFVLTGKENAQSICQSLVQGGLGQVTVFLGENLGGDQEQITQGTAYEIAQKVCSILSVLLIENLNAVNPNFALRDQSFLRGKVPMTKQQVRWTAVNLLDLCQAKIVYDIGAGTGSVAIEMARKAQKGIVYAIEQKQEGIDLILKNKSHLGSGNVIPILGRAPHVLQDLPMPDAAFIGGSTGELHEILKVLKQKNPCIRVCISAIALETLSLAMQAMKDLEFCDLEVCQLAVSHGNSVGAYTMMTANNPVFLICGGGSCGTASD